MTDTDQIVVGCKLVSPSDECYPDDGEWHEIPGDGAYVAVTAGLDFATDADDDDNRGDTLAWLECCEPTGVPAPVGVVCYRRVRRIPADPDRISPELRGEIAYYCADITTDQRIALAEASTPEWRGKIACYSHGLSAEQRIAFARTSTPEWRGRVASSEQLDFTSEQRVDLAMDSTPEGRAWVALLTSPGLTIRQFFGLAKLSTQETQEWLGDCDGGISAKQFFAQARPRRAPTHPTSPPSSGSPREGI